jgi:hypothetical protein
MRTVVYKRRFFILLFLVAICANGQYLVAQNGSQASGYDQWGHPAWVNIPKPERVEATSDNAKTVVQQTSNLSVQQTNNISVRQARNLLFNNIYSKPLIPHDPTDKNISGGGGADFYETTSPTPTSMSDATVIGTAVSFQPFWSADKSVVYSELEFIPTEIIKDKSNNLTPKSSLVILQRGGTLQMPDGKIVKSVPYGGSNPIRLETRYLLFLRYHPQEQCFTVIRSWDLSHEQPREMDNDGQEHVGRPKSIENRFASETDLITHVKAQ